MPISKLDQTIIQSLGARRSQVAAQIEAIQSADLSGLQAELTAIEAKLKDIDAGIPTLTEDKIAAQVQLEIEAKAQLVAATASAAVSVDALAAVPVSVAPAKGELV